MRRRLGFGLDSGWVLDTQKLTTVPSFKSMVTGCKPDLLKPDLYVRSIASDKLKQPVITEKYKCEDTKKRKIFELKDICGVVCCVVLCLVRWYWLRDLLRMSTFYYYIYTIKGD